MKQKKYDNLSNQIYNVCDDKSLHRLFDSFGGMNYYTETDAVNIKNARAEFLNSKPEAYFEQIGIPHTEKATFIFFELLFIEELLKPIYRLKLLEGKSELEKADLVSTFEKALDTMGYQFGEYDKQLQRNFDNNMPVTVNNLISHLNHLSESIDEWICDTPFKKVIQEKLAYYRQHYSTDRLYKQLMLIKAGKHQQSENAKQNWSFAELFKSEQDYRNVMAALSKKDKVDPKSGLWKDTGGGHKKEIICFIKQLQTKGHFIKDPIIDNDIVQSVMKNSFGIRTGISFISKVKPTAMNLDWIPECKAA